MDQIAIIRQNLERTREEIREAEKALNDCARAELDFINGQYDSEGFKEKERELFGQTEAARTNLRHLNWTLRDLENQLAEKLDKRQLFIF